MLDAGYFHNRIADLEDFVIVESMIHTEHTFSFLILILGIVIVANIFIRACLKRVGVPGLVGYFLVGLLLRIADDQFAVLGETGWAVVEFLASVGVLALLFRIGLESNLHGLLSQLPRAGFVWIGNIVVSGLSGYWIGRLLDLPLVSSLFVAAAMTATSVGVSVNVWREKNKLRSRDGELLIDVAELDDISGICFMVLLFALAPLLHEAGSDTGVLTALSRTAGWFVLKLVLFTAACLAFSRYLEKPLSRLFRKIGEGYAPTLLITGTGFIIAAIAGWLGFSLAIGALFAGLVFSRDPESVKIDTGFEAIYDLFAPFFFVGIGLRIDPGALSSALALGIVLLLVATVSKIVGTALPALKTSAPAGALLIGLSMVPRAEITMIIMQRGRELGDWAVPADLYAGMVVVSAATCTLVPSLLSRLISRWYDRPEKA